MGSSTNPTNQTMGSNDLSRELICVQFPGIVKNDDKALECLGGIRNISEVFAHPTKKRLGLNFQPQNPYVKKIFGDNKQTAGVLLKLKVKKTKDGDKVKREVVDTTVVGRVNRMYKFDSMCDFQYLPAQVKGEDSQPQCLLDEILPSGVDNIDFTKKNSSLYVVPANFMRSDKPINYAYTDKRYPDRSNRALKEEDDDDDVHNKRRLDRGTGMTHYTFNLTDSLPMEPHEVYLKQQALRLSVYPPLAQEMETIQKLFAERPIWSMNLLRYETKIKTGSLKLIMPCLALYMKDGPWRMTWVRYGYDPRKEPEARIYQTLDFRLRHQAGVHSMVASRDEMLYYKRTARVRANTRASDTGAEVPEGSVRFRPGMVPTQRQIYYQYCDVKLPEVEELVATPPPAGYLCHEKRGWLPPGVDQACRDHIFNYVKRTLLADRNAEFKLEQTSSEDEGNSDDGVTSLNTTEIDDLPQIHNFL